MLKNGVIESFISLYVFNIVIVRKKNRMSKGINRICINFTPFNKVIEKDSDSILIIKKYLLLFYKVKWLTILNLVSTY